MARQRRAVSWALAGVVAPALFLTGTPADAASGSITAPGDGATVTSGAAFTIGATLSRGALDTGAVTMSLTAPGEVAREVDRASGSDKELRFTFDPRCPDYGSGCGGRAALNGSYVVTLAGSGANDSATFSLQVAPLPPANASATATGQRQVTVSWSAGSEPDLTSYELFERTGSSYTTVALGLSPTTTSYAVTYPSSGYGGDHTFAVRSRRRACPGCSQTIESSMSSTGTVTLTEPGSSPPPDPDPTASPSPSGGGFNGEPSPDPGGNGNGSGNGNGKGHKDPTPAPAPTTDAGGYNTGGSTAGPATSGSSNTTAAAATKQRLAYGLTFKDFAPKLGAPKLPPLPKYAPAPIPEGTYNPSLPYANRTVREAIGTTNAGPARQVLDSLVKVFHGDRVARSIAWALILLLAATHVRLWLRRTPIE